MSNEGDCRTAPATHGLLIRKYDVLIVESDILFQQTWCSRDGSTNIFVTDEIIERLFSSKPSKHQYTQTVRAKEL